MYMGRKSLRKAMLRALSVLKKRQNMYIQFELQMIHMLIYKKGFPLLSLIFGFNSFLMVNILLIFCLGEKN